MNRLLLLLCVQFLTLLHAADDLAALATAPSMVALPEGPSQCLSLAARWTEQQKRLPPDDGKRGSGDLATQVQQQRDLDAALVILRKSPVLTGPSLEQAAKSIATDRLVWVGKIIAAGRNPDEIWAGADAGAFLVTAATIDQAITAAELADPIFKQPPWSEFAKSTRRACAKMIEQLPKVMTREVDTFLPGTEQDRLNRMIWNWQDLLSKQVGNGPGKEIQSAIIAAKRKLNGMCIEAQLAHGSVGAQQAHPHLVETLGHLNMVFEEVGTLSPEPVGNDPAWSAVQTAITTAAEQQNPAPLMAALVSWRERASSAEREKPRHDLEQRLAKNRAQWPAPLSEKQLKAIDQRAGGRTAAKKKRDAEIAVMNNNDRELTEAKRTQLLARYQKLAQDEESSERSEVADERLLAIDEALKEVMAAESAWHAAMDKSRPAQQRAQALVIDEPAAERQRSEQQAQDRATRDRLHAESQSAREAFYAFLQQLDQSAGAP